jgi:hypothetical protein
MWADKARTRWLRAALIAAGGAHLMGMVGAGHEQRKVARVRRGVDTIDRCGQGASGARC